MSAALLVVSLVLWWYLGHLNKKKHEVQFSEQVAELRDKSLEELGEYHPGMFHPVSRASSLTYLMRQIFSILLELSRLSDARFA